MYLYGKCNRGPWKEVLVCKRKKLNLQGVIVVLGQTILKLTCAVETTFLRKEMLDFREKFGSTTFGRVVEEFDLDMSLLPKKVKV